MKKIILIIIILCTSGCWDRREIRELGVVNSAIWDYKNKNYILTAEIVNPKTQSTLPSGISKTIPYLYVKGEGKTIPDASYNINESFSKTISAAHVNALFISEEMAKKKGIGGLLDYLSRYRDSRQQQYIMILKGNPDMFFKTTTSLSDFFGDFVGDIKDAQDYRLSSTVFVSVLDVLKDYYNNGTQPIMGVVESVKEKKGEETNSSPDVKTKSKTKLKFEGMAVFKQDKFKSACK